MPFQKPLKLFIAYAHEDESFKDELTKWLEPLKQKNEIEFWHDGKLVLGYKYPEAIDRYLKNADVVLYLVSSDSLASDACNEEIAKALDNQKRFVPIILRECDWKRHKVSEASIVDFPALPKDGKPIDSWENKDKAWQNVIDGIHKILDTEKEQEDTHQNTLFELGNAKYMLGALDEARIAYTKAIELEPNLAEAYNNRGILFNDLKEYDKAKADFTKAIALNPDLAIAYAARVLLKMFFYGPFPVIKALLTRLVNNMSGTQSLIAFVVLSISIVASVTTVLMWTAYIENEYAVVKKETPSLLDDVESKHLPSKYKAEAAYAKAIELKPDDAKTYNSRGNLFSGLGQYDKAEADYNKAIKLDPNYAEAYNGRGILFSDLKEYDKAEADYNKAIKLDPNHVKAYNNRGNLFSKLKQYNKAEADYTKAIKIEPEYAEAYNGRGGLFEKLEQYDKAEADYTKAIKIEPEHFRAYSNRGSLFDDLEQYKKAEKDFNKAIEIKYNYAEAYFGRGVLFGQLGQYENAEKDFNKAIEIKSNYIEAYASRGVLFGQLGQYEKSEKDFNKAIEIKSNYAEAYFGRGVLFGQLGQSEKAIADIEKAKKIFLEEDNKVGIAFCELLLKDLRENNAL